MHGDVPPGQGGGAALVGEVPAWAVVDARAVGREALVRSTIYLEGGGDSRDLQIRCREGFRKLLERCSYAGRLPRLVACGGRGAAFDAFKTALGSSRKGDFVALWIDSEDQVANIEATWAHLQ